MEQTIIDNVESTEQDLVEEEIVETLSENDYIEQLETIIELQTINNNLVAQGNVNQLFVIGTLSAILVCMVLYKAIKKFI